MGVASVSFYRLGPMSERAAKHIAGSKQWGYVPDCFQIKDQKPGYFPRPGWYVIMQSEPDRDAARAFAGRFA